MISTRASAHRPWQGAGAAALLLTLLGAAPGVQAAATALADQPFITTVNVPGNVALALSVEYPTATSIANGIVNYASGTTYYGNFDATKCYYYNIATTKTAAPSNGSYFAPVAAAASDHSCTGAAASSLWSGNFLNWASMSTIDPFRWALTGGYRSVDTATLTILEKAWAPPAQASATESPVQTTSQSTYPNLTPFSGWSSIATTVFRLGQYMCFTANTGSINTTNGTIGSPAAAYTTSSTNWSGSLSNATEYTSGSTVDTTHVYCTEVRVKVCDATAVPGLEGNCVAYPAGNYKPEGLIQKYSQQMRFASFGYLLDSAANGNIGVRDGGVMRARMKFVGPTAPVPGSTSITNGNAEWSATTGQFIANPDPTDVTSTLAMTGCTGCSVPNSGVMNYVNLFGEHARGLGHSTGYKGYDNVSELYYTVLRYYKELGNVHEYTDLTATNTDLSKSDCVTANADQCVDGFPVITNWYPTDASAPRGADYPVQYSCQKNFIIGIADENTHQDGNLPGTYSGGAYLSSANGSGYEPPLETAVAADATLNTTAVNTTNVTTWIGTQETTVNGLSVATTGALGQTSWNSYGACCGGATFYIAGMAYDAHVHDMLPNAFLNPDGTKSSTQTLSSYFVDVLEYGTFRNQNQYWLAAKYGGFTVPNGYTEFSTPTVGGVAWPTSMWAANGRTVANGATNYTVPDNYFSGRDAGAMVSGLANAFAQISSAISATTTALSLGSPHVVSTNNASYSVNYDSSTWTSQLIGSSLSYDAQGNPTPTQVWDALAVLETQVSGGGFASGARNIATWNDASKAGVPFVATSLSSAEQADLVPTSTTFTAAQVVSYLRGDRSNEGSSGAALFRARATPGLLGDVVDAKAVTVGPPNAAITSASNPGYSKFKTTYAKRTTVVYVGSNDGMLHGFDGSISATDTHEGQELFAYVPGALYAGPSGTPYVNGLVARTYKNFVHYNYVDATPVVTDVDFKNAGGSFNKTASEWHSLLVGGLGKGGKAFYALDVTDPSVMTSDAAVASKVLWEFNQSTITSYGSAATIGYSFGPALVTKTAKYGWVVILTSGYNNSDGSGYFFFVNPATGALLEPPLSTGTGSSTAPIGMAFASAFVPDYSDGTADAVYAGDLYGNIWRVDLTTTTGNYAAPVRIATATDASGATQSITTRPLIEISSSTAKRYVLFGTGRTLASSDLSNAQTNSIYSVWDGTGSYGAFFTSASPLLPSGVTYPVQRSQMQAVTNALQGVSSAVTNKMGWYEDLAAATATLPAEQVDVEPNADNGVAAFGINLSNGSACSPSGSGRVVAFDVGTGVTALQDSAGNALATFQLSGRVADLTFVNVNGSAIRLTAGTDATVSPLVNINGTYSTTGKSTKLNWREVKGAN